ncbi:16S rRNA (cytosine967-C5)-methyltransferase [Aliiroseovarius halocynthiae]|uniref:RsmB/NOP family class I SAM-dependent RNA methyltransferase n=1 Tax=Aliiroseovarius halocynthiae TaxID=985055 RepID=A0A545SWE8_9RHOB|nr:RsmB/NOP family class I SAM-dependent RNA methyltransferase [Aliiroseovarius halocynthiae]TQV69293.1 RsmB/NOP family class I SAM-dependent RNA methyltransferase [Aliiroseovarius halocynthiae]SMR72068.1 16S rRNA (cytosine967-C5)-methyltransferase [Aliiroseovarius halocynthiae]
MTPGARVAAAIEVLDSYLSGTPVEQALTGWARGHRFAGSKDRAAIRDHVFDALRRLRSAQALGGGTDGRAVMIGLLRGQGLDPAELFSGEGHAPAKLSDAELAVNAQMSRAEALDCPDWLLPQFDRSLGADADTVLGSLRSRAPVFVRANLAKCTREQAASILAEDGIEAQLCELAGTALEIVKNPRKIKLSRAFLDGYVELQDAASQAVIEALDIQPGMRVLDYCAGGGGKALAMAALGAYVTAHDLSWERMKDIPDRAARAGVSIQRVRNSDMVDLSGFDLVLADAPCSGSGSWRRAPHGKWLLTSEKLEQIYAAQRDILTAMPDFVCSGGTMAYATCSVLTDENSAQVQAFLSRNAGFSLIAERQFTPRDGGDGFYIAQLTSS